ncbi:MAG: hypothetical protein V4689_16400 [Verrucomicrobiota bacterium]
MRNLAFLVIVAASAMMACSTAPRERAVSITAKPNFKSDPDFKDYHTFETDGPDGRRSIYWPDTAPKPKRMDKNRYYTLDLFEEEWKPFSNDPERVFWRPELFRVHDGGKLLYDASVCGKHHTQMERKLVKISYGLPSRTPEWMALRKNAPNEGTVLGGCCVDENRLETRTWVCPVCKSIHDDSVARMSHENQ